MKTKIIELLKSSKKKFLRKREISKILKINQKEYKTFRIVLKTLLNDGVVAKNKKGHFFLLKSKKIKFGLLSLTIHGYGFVSFEDKHEDIYINPKNLLGALDGDLVEVIILPSTRRHKSEGIIKSIIKRKSNEFIAQVIKNNKKILLNIEPVTPLRGVLLEDINKNFKIGDIIRVKVSNWGNENSHIIVKYKETIGSINDPSTDMKLICQKYELDNTFNDYILKYSNKWTEKDIYKEKKNRKDLTSLNVLTIDPSDARDVDDGVSIYKNNKNNYVVGVHIADVSFFLDEGSPLDSEAQKRSNSVYFIEGVIRMIPDNLSANICSLLPNKERLAISFFIEIDKNMNLSNFRLEKTIIKSKKQFTYSEVQKIIENKSGEFFEDINNLNKIAKKLRIQRENKGSIDFNIPEPLIKLDKNGIPNHISQKERYDSHRLIEEFMLLANRVVAEKVINKQKKDKDGFVFRIHPKPNLADMEIFFNTLIKLSIIKKFPSMISTLSIKKILSNQKKTEHKNIIEKLALRSMSKAIYSTKKDEHFGLAFKHYCHFTSPIRRYSDIIVHRYLKKHFLGDNKRILSFEKASKVAEEITKSEIKSLEAEREYLRLKQLRWLSLRIGQNFSAIISGVINSGFFAEIDKIFVEGFIPITKLKDDTYFFDDNQISIIGKNYFNKFYLGKVIKIEVLNVDFKTKRAEFTLID